MPVDHCCRAPQEDRDRFIFEVFNLMHNKRDISTAISKRAVTKEELCVMIMNLPKDAVIVSKFKPDGNGPETNKKELPPFSSLAGGDQSKVQQQALEAADLKQAQFFTIEKKDAKMGNERLIIGD